MKLLVNSRRSRSEPPGGEPVEVALPTGRRCSLRRSGRRARRSQEEARALVAGSLRAVVAVAVGAIAVEARVAVVGAVKQEGRTLFVTKVTSSVSSARHMGTMQIIAPVRRRRTRRHTM
jgi:hypothetical protein